MYNTVDALLLLFTLVFTCFYPHQCGASVQHVVVVVVVVVDDDNDDYIDGDGKGGGTTPFRH